MYGWIWRKLPFGVPGKLIGSLLITASVFALLWYVVFPWAEPLLPFDDVQVTQDVDDPGGSQDAGVNGDSDQVDEDANSVPSPTHDNNPEPTATR